MLVGRKEAQDVRNHEDAVALLCGRKHPCAIGRCQREGLFAEHMLARGERSERCWHVQGRWQADVNGVDGRIGEHCVKQAGSVSGIERIVRRRGASDHLHLTQIRRGGKVPLAHLSRS